MNFNQTDSLFYLFFHWLTVVFFFLCRRRLQVNVSGVYNSYPSIMYSTAHKRVKTYCPVFLSCHNVLKRPKRLRRSNRLPESIQGLSNLCLHHLSKPWKGSVFYPLSERNKKDPGYLATNMASQVSQLATLLQNMQMPDMPQVVK